MALLRGMKDSAAEHHDAARGARLFDSERSRAPRGARSQGSACSGDVNALASFAGKRREALWQSVAAEPDKDMLAVAPCKDETPELGVPIEANDVVADCRSLGLTLGRHPLNCCAGNYSRRSWCPRPCCARIATDDWREAAGS